MKTIEAIHAKAFVDRRVSKLAPILAGFLPASGQCLDVGCGDGRLVQLIMNQRPELHFQGIDTLVRKNTVFPVQEYDGRVIPFPDASFDAVLFVDVLHHLGNPTSLMREARRVSRGVIVLKDHLLEGMLAGPTLRFMDKVGNRRFGVSLPYNFWRLSRWEEAWQELGLSVARWDTNLRIYPWYCSWLFDRGLHFVVRLERGAMQE